MISLSGWARETAILSPHEHVPNQRSSPGSLIDCHSLVPPQSHFGMSLGPGVEDTKLSLMWPPFGCLCPFEVNIVYCSFSMTLELRLAKPDSCDLSVAP